MLIDHMTIGGHNIKLIKDTHAGKYEVLVGMELWNDANTFETAYKQFLGAIKAAYNDGLPR